MKSNRAAGFFKTLLLVLVLFYPLAVYFGLKKFSVGTLGWFLVVVMALRMISANARDPLGFAALFGAGVGLLLNLSATITGDSQLIKFYPVAMSTIFFFVFAASLFSRQTVVARLAQRFRGELSPRALQYTTKVTVVWSLFFLFNGIIATYTVVRGSDETWTLYNGLISYVLMGGLFLGEFAFRRLVMQKADV